MNWTLGIDSSTMELGIGLYGDAVPRGGYSRYIGNSHAEHIAGSVEFILGENGLCADDIGRIGIAIGPGSFTGLRIGIAFMKGFFFGRPVKVLPVSSLESAAVSIAGTADSIVTAFDARRDAVYWARFIAAGTSVRRITDDRLTAAAEFRSALGDGDIVVTDTLGNGKCAVFDSLPASARALPAARYPLQRGVACARIAAMTPDDSPLWRSPAETEPCYMRASAPEEKMYHTT